MLSENSLLVLILQGAMMAGKKLLIKIANIIIISWNLFQFVSYLFQFC